jgi:hypothetical protein
MLPLLLVLASAVRPAPAAPEPVPVPPEDAVFATVLVPPIRYGDFGDLPPPIHAGDRVRLIEPLGESAVLVETREGARISINWGGLDLIGRGRVSVPKQIWLRDLDADGTYELIAELDNAADVLGVSPEGLVRLGRVPFGPGMHRDAVLQIRDRSLVVRTLFFRASFEDAEPVVELHGQRVTWTLRGGRLEQSSSVAQLLTSGQGRPEHISHGVLRDGTIHVVTVQGSEIPVHELEAQWDFVPFALGKRGFYDRVTGTPPR